ncbi:hypothetical protein [Litorihabitans aurantiacus]|uniref:Uncharacterized protein n=1 Tax=Litorihabitans aurantiacus TaxID=1930061 RepID=A0AA37UU11_9MICO|nr:hypothetical protein [Litorihabitans aurantiacus]GMA30447.1 hypothetical protein GCM10025875_04390 [Litorihabitans aurantiacus]
MTRHENTDATEVIPVMSDSPQESGPQERPDGAASPEHEVRDAPVASEDQGDGDGAFRPR